MPSAATSTRMTNRASRSSSHVGRGDAAHPQAAGDATAAASRAAPAPPAAAARPPARPARRTPSATTRAAARPRPATAPRPAPRRAPASAATAPSPPPTRRTGRRRRRSRPPSPRPRRRPAGPRASPSTTMFGANRHTTDATMCSTMPAISGRRRPSESDSGPTISWPSASPASVPVSVSCTTDDDTDRSSAMRGSAGRYMSMVSGPSATSRPSTTIIRARLGGRSTSITSVSALESPRQPMLP